MDSSTEGKEKVVDEEWIDESGMEVEVTLGARSRTDGKAKLIQTFINLIFIFFERGKNFVFEGNIGRPGWKSTLTFTATA